MEHIKEKTVKDTTKQMYLKNMTRLNDGEEVKDLGFLKDTKKIESKLSKYKPNSKRTYLISIVSVLKDVKGFAEIYKHYYDEMMKLNTELKVNNTKSDTQKENWLSQDEVRQRFAEMFNDVKPLFTLKKLNEEQYKKFLNLVVLSLYVLQPVRRNKDYQLMRVVPNTKKITSIPDYKDFNYLDLSTQKFLFYNFKTSGTYHLQEIDVSPELYHILSTFLKFHPNKKAKDHMLLVDFEGKPFIQINSITRILNKIFGKNVGVSLLRNIFLTDEFGDNFKKMQKTATAMGTSSSTIENNYIKID